MGTLKQRGFTIIEVTLFMAITSLLIVALLGGWTAATNAQSYKDSARSLAAAFQHEFTLVTNVRNERISDQACDGNGTAVGTAPRGTTDCIMMGRYIDFDGSQLVSTYITGYELQAGAGSGATDLDIIKSYVPKSATTAALKTTENIRWSSSPYASLATKATVLRFAMVIVRSPATGTVYTYWQTYTTPGTAPTVTTILTAPPAPTNRVICLDPKAIMLGEPLAVVINAGASSSAGVRVLSKSGGSGC